MMVRSADSVKAFQAAETGESARLGAVLAAISLRATFEECK